MLVTSNILALLEEPFFLQLKEKLNKILNRIPPEKIFLNTILYIAAKISLEIKFSKSVYMRLKADASYFH